MFPLCTNSKFFSLALKVFRNLLSNHIPSLSWNASCIKIRFFPTTRRRHVQLSSVTRHSSRNAREHEIFWGILFLATDAGFQGQQSSRKIVQHLSECLLLFRELPLCAAPLPKYRVMVPLLIFIYIRTLFQIKTNFIVSE